MRARMSSKAIPYHSALQDDLDLPELSFYESAGSTVFQHDLTAEIPEIFRTVDVIYSEPAWRAGYEVFQERSKPTTVSTFKVYLEAIKKFIATLNKPTFMIIGKHMLKALMPNDGYYEIMLNKWEAILGLWNIDEVTFDALNMEGGLINNNNVIDFVVTRYNIIGDFSCGYGNVAASAVKNGKKFVCSDLNAKCVYYIAKNYMGYDK
jgi:hypothetical protein